MLKIWGRSNSVNVEKVLWTCEELCIPYERVDAGGQFGIVNTPQYRALNPNGLVPTVEVDGLVLWESNSVVRYLTARDSAGELWPQDPAERAVADRWMDWMNTVYWPAFKDLFWNLVRTPLERRDQAAIEHSHARSSEVLGYLDAHLSDSDYIAGNQLTMGDIPMGCAVWRWMSLPIERPQYAALKSWFNRLCQRPCYQKTVMKPLT
ncbi:MAG: glutathione S-transferase family protein [Betaproteobacteria bacterium]|jgi:glutathione S-transferase|nr:MAG: glutathione S-transferase family protein [Betaproteobacteria bacterium]